MTNRAQPILAANGLTVRYGGTVALNSVSLDFFSGTCHALVGENGAGKSTLGKVLAGVIRPDSGILSFADRQTKGWPNPGTAQEAGIFILHQELPAFPNLSVAENLFIAQLPNQLGVVDRQAVKTRAREVLSSFASHLDPEAQFGKLSAGEQQLALISQAIYSQSKVLIFDEPTSSLSEVEAQRLLETIKELKRRGHCCIYVSHRMHEVFEIADTVSILRDGELVGTYTAADLDADAVAEKMSGRKREEIENEQRSFGGVVLKIDRLSSPPAFQNLSLEVREGEIVGLAGLVGAGRTELLEAVFGVRKSTGTVVLNGSPYDKRNPSESLRRGLGLLPEDRKTLGLCLELPVLQNAALSTLEARSNLGVIDRAAEREAALESLLQVRTKYSELGQAVGSLSGGNQQKVLFARLALCGCRALLLDEPTRGVDVQAKAEIHRVILDLARSGVGVLIASSDLAELFALSDRVVVLREGVDAGEVLRVDFSDETVLKLMAFGKLLDKP